MNEQHRKKIALFIDANDTTYEMLDYILKDCEDQGELIIKRVYANWQELNQKKWLIKAQAHSIKTVQQPSYTAINKNSTDIPITLDVMECIHTTQCDEFIFATGNKDLSPLIIRLKEAHKTVKGYCYDLPPQVRQSFNVCVDLKLKMEQTRQEAQKKAQRDKIFEEVFKPLSAPLDITQTQDIAQVSQNLEKLQKKIEDTIFSKKQK